MGSWKAGPSVMIYPHLGSLDYHSFRFEKANNRRLLHHELMVALDELTDRHWIVMDIGRSLENREIKAIRWGNGPNRIIMWTQMHGNEPTATLAVLDLLNLFNQHYDWLADLKDKISLMIIPMVNPDGAERFQRRNAADIDLNRDAQQLAAPESRTLMSAIKDFEPQWAFNLHDQYIRYGIGDSDKIAAISILAPSADYKRTDTPARLKAKQLLASLIPDIDYWVSTHISRYDDTFSPRCFGDQVQLMGISTVLIESGGWAFDLHKDKIRQANVMMVLSAFHSIATGDYQNGNLDYYQNIPLNGNPVFDLVLEQVSLNQWASSLRSVDIGIHYIPFENGLTDEEEWVGIIQDIGDLSLSPAIDRINMENAQLFNLKPFMLKEEHGKSDIENAFLRGEGLAFIPPVGGMAEKWKSMQYPVTFFESFEEQVPTTLKSGKWASFVAQSTSGKKSIWMNGFKVYDAEEGLLKPSPFYFKKGSIGREVTI